MSPTNPMWRRYLRLFGADPRADVDDELGFHLQERTDELVGRGLTPHDARREAERRLGDVHRIKHELAEVARLQRRRERLSELGRDVLLALRRLRREPAFATMAIATLTMGIGAAVGVFAVVDAVVLRPLPYPDPERLVQVSPSQNFNIALADELGAARTLEASSGLSQWSLTLTGNGEPAVLNAQVVDAEFFRVLGVQPILGRPFRPEERDPALSDVVILSYGMWQTRFGGDRDVINRRIDLDGSGHATRRIIGVMPQGFVAPLVASGTEIGAWIPLSRASGRTIATDSTWYVNAIVGRLATGVTVDQAAREVRLITTRAQREFPGRLYESRVETAGAMGLLDSMVGELRTPLLALLGAVGLVMLLACVNLANLLLARGDRRRRELAVRAALGAGRPRLVREQLTDSVVIAALGAAGGIMLARVLIAALDVGRASSLPRAAALAVDVRALAFALCVSLLAAIAFGSWPALRGARGDMREALGASVRSTGSQRANRLGVVLVAGEIALATVLVTAAGLLLGSLRALRAVDPGLDPIDVVAMRLEPAGGRYEGGSARVLYDQVFERLRAIPGVRTVGAIHLLPFTMGNWSFPYLAEGQPPPDGPLPSTNFRVVTPDYFDAVDQPLLEGRMLTDADRQMERLTFGLVNRRMARELWPDESAVGKTIWLFGSQPFEVVGVVGDVRQFALDMAPQPEMYVPHGAGWSLAAMVVMLETTGDTRSVMRAAQRAVWAVDPDIPISGIRGLDDVLGESTARRRFFAAVLSYFAALALALGAVGVYGVMSYTMGGRRAEFGIRMALGATRSRVLGGALRAGVIPIVMGLAAGLVGSAFATRLLESLLFGVAPGDPATGLMVAVVLWAVAVTATFIPAYRATGVDAAVVMRAE